MDKDMTYTAIQRLCDERLLIGVPAPELKDIIIAVITDVDRQRPIYTDDLALLMSRARLKESNVWNIRNFLLRESASLHQCDRSPLLDDILSSIPQYVIEYDHQHYGHN